MNLLNELLNLSEAKQGSSLIGLTMKPLRNVKRDQLVTDQTKDEIWTGNFRCFNNPELTSLEGAPKEVTGDFSVDTNPKLTSLKGAPAKVDGIFNLDNNLNLVSLEGAPKIIGGGFYCARNPKIISLKGIHKQVTSMDGKFRSYKTPIKSHVLGLLLIKGCTGVSLDNREVEAILNKYLPNTRGNKGLIDCQSELLDADLEDYAEL